MSLATVFTGIEMFALGLGEPPEWQAETEPYPRAVCELRYPDAIQLGDVKSIDAGVPKVTELAGGFPCQDLSRAGRNAGLAGKRSGLWFEFERIIGLVQPERVYIENVPDLLRKGMCALVEGLTGMGYSVEWDCLPAAVLGAHHLRDRVWIVAHRKPVPYIFGPAAGLFPRKVTEPGSPGWLKWPRAGFARKAGYVQELQPMAPLARVKRGMLLTGAARAAGGLLPTVVRSDSKGSRRATAKTPEWASNDGTTLLDAVLQGAGRDLLPTPVADDVKGDVVGHLRNKNGWDSAKRTRITSLAVLARNGFEQPSDEQLEEAHRSAEETDRARERGWTAEYPTPTAAPFAHGGGGGEMQKAVKRSLLPTPTEQDAHNDGGPSQYDRNSLPLNTHVKIFPTPKAEPSGPDFARAKRPRSGGDDLVTAVARDPFPTPRASDGDKRNRGDLIAHAKDRPNSHHGGPDRAPDRPESVAGQLNPTWVEWLMGVPIGWTDLAVPNDELVLHSWAQEPEGVPRIIENAADRTNRLSALGNALVPQIPAFIASRARR